jgi:hypothetical protein
MMSSLEDLAIAAYLISIVEASAALRLRRAADGIVRLRQWARASLAESLGGVSSVNVRGKMLAKLRDVPFLVRAGQPCLRAPVGSSLPAAVNQVRRFQAVLRIRIRRIRMFFWAFWTDPDPLVRGMDPDPSVIKQEQ